MLTLNKFLKQTLKFKVSLLCCFSYFIKHLINIPLEICLYKRLTLNQFIYGGLFVDKRRPFHELVGAGTPTLQIKINIINKFSSNRGMGGDMVYSVRHTIVKTFWKSTVPHFHMDPAKAAPGINGTSEWNLIHHKNLVRLGTFLFSK